MMQTPDMKTAPDRSVPPAINGFPEAHLDMPEWHMLDNGMRVYVVNGGEEDVCQIEVSIGCGLCEQEKRNAAMMLGYMLNRGSEHYTDEEMSEQFDFYGASMKVKVSEHATSVTMRCVNDNLDCLLPIFLDMLRAPKLPADEFKRIIDEQVANGEVYSQMVSMMANIRLSEIKYGANSMLVYDVSGKSYKALTIDDIRKLHEEYYSPDNCYMVVSGKITDEVLRKVEGCMLQWQRRPFKPQKEPLKEPEDIRFAVVDKPGALQTAVIIDIDAIGRKHPDYVPLRILTTAFGGYFGSRLMSNIREDKGYTYGINGFLCSGSADNGHISVTTQCATDVTQNVIDEIRHEMRRLREEPIGEDELNLVRNHMLTELSKTFDTPFAMASYIGMVESFGCDKEYFNDQHRLLRSITPQQLQEMANKYLVEDKMITVLAGDAKKLADINVD